MKKIVVTLLLAFILMQVACAGEQPSAPPTDAAELESGNSATAEPAASEALPAEPQEITFQASDGQVLQGRYYPAGVDSAPLVVLMHWVNGDMNDWNEIAVWLQNRGLANPYPNPGEEGWWDPTWFPPMPENVSYGVFIFSFRDCQPFPTSCAGWTPELWLLDAQAAMLKATTLEGVDATRIVAIGSSIGGDGAIDGCTLLNEQIPGSCQGAASLGPGDYMEIPYATAVEKLGQEQPPKLAWCFVDPLNAYDYSVCQAISGEDFTMLEFPGGGHGQTLLREEVTPSALEAVIDFLAAVFGP